MGIHDAKSCNAARTRSTNVLFGDDNDGPTSVEQARGREALADQLRRMKDAQARADRQRTEMKKNDRMKFEQRLNVLRDAQRAGTAGRAVRTDIARAFDEFVVSMEKVAGTTSELPAWNTASVRVAFTELDSGLENAWLENKDTTGFARNMDRVLAAFQTISAACGVPTTTPIEPQKREDAVADFFAQRLVDEIVNGLPGADTSDAATATDTAVSGAFFGLPGDRESVSERSRRYRSRSREEITDETRSLDAKLSATASLLDEDERGLFLKVRMAVISKMNAALKLLPESVRAFVENESRQILYGTAILALAGLGAGIWQYAVTWNVAAVSEHHEQLLQTGAGIARDNVSDTERVEAELSRLTGFFEELRKAAMSPLEATKLLLAKLTPTREGIATIGVLLQDWRKRGIEAYAMSDPSRSVEGNEQLFDAYAKNLIDSYLAVKRRIGAGEDPAKWIREWRDLLSQLATPAVIEGRVIPEYLIANIETSIRVLREAALSLSTNGKKLLENLLASRTNFELVRAVNLKFATDTPVTTYLLNLFASMAGTHSSFAKVMWTQYAVSADVMRFEAAFNAFRTASYDMLVDAVNGQFASTFVSTGMLTLFTQLVQGLAFALGTTSAALRYAVTLVDLIASRVKYLKNISPTLKSATEWLAAGQRNVEKASIFLTFFSTFATIGTLFVSIVEAAFLALSLCVGTLMAWVLAATVLVGVGVVVYATRSAARVGGLAMGIGRYLAANVLIISPAVTILLLTLQGLHMMQQGDPSVPPVLVNPPSAGGNASAWKGALESAWQHNKSSEESIASLNASGYGVAEALGGLSYAAGKVFGAV